MSRGHPADGVRRPLWRRELSIWLILVAFYFVMTAVDWDGRHRAALTNSRWLFELERSLRVDIELGLNRWLVPREGLRVLANYEYALTYIISSFGVLVWLYLRRPLTYRWARTSFILLNVVSLICFKLYPVAPPRLVPDLGFVDTVVLDQTWGSWGSPWASRVNQLAAMPSLHIGWAIWVSLILLSIATGWLVQVVSGVHVVVTVLVIMATANHYLIDAVVGALLTAACVAVTRPRAANRSHRPATMHWSVPLPEWRALYRRRATLRRADGETVRAFARPVYPRPWPRWVRPREIDQDCTNTHESEDKTGWTAQPDRRPSRYAIASVRWSPPSSTTTPSVRDSRAAGTLPTYSLRGWRRP